MADRDTTSSYGEWADVPDVIDRARRAARELSADLVELRASGWLEHAAIELFEPAKRAYGNAMTLGPVELVSLVGVVAMNGSPTELHAVLAQNGEVLAGRLTVARGGRLHVIVSAVTRAVAAAPSRPASLADAARALDAATVARAPARPEPPREPPRPPEPEPIPESHEEIERPEPEVGDLLDHPSFGIVEISGEGDSGRVKIKLHTGSQREIMLDVFDIVPREERNGKRFFALRPRRR